VDIQPDFGVVIATGHQVVNQIRRLIWFLPGF
jgi:hypothetical protein